MVESTSNNATGDGDGANSALRAKISELERELREERDRLIVEQSQAEVAKFVARQEVEKCRRDCSGLQDRVARLEEDCDTLREREAKGQERIKSLVEVIEAKERDFQEKFIEMKVEIRDLECGKNRAVAEVVEWRKRCEELAEENLRLKGGEMVVAGEVDEEMPQINEGHLSTPERKRSSEFLGVGNESESMGEDGCDERIPLRQLKNRRVAEVSDGAGKDSGCGGPCEEADAEPAGTGNSEPAGTSGEVADLQIPSSPATGKQEDLEISRNSKSLLEVVENKHKLLTRNRSPRSKKKFQSFILRCSSTGRNSATSGCDSVAAGHGLQSDLKSGRSSSNQKHERGYTGRVASSEQKDRALARAEKLKGNLNNNHPSFVKPVTRSHVSTCFRLAFPPKFCEEVFSAHDHLKMVLEDEKGVEHQVKYIRARGALCGGWKGFASGKNLEIGDALVFELSEPTRFKVYVIKAHQESSTEVFINSKSAQEDGKTAQEDDKIAQEETDGVIKQADSKKSETDGVNKQADSKKSETDGVIKQADSKKSETDGVIKQADSKKSEKRVKPLRTKNQKVNLQESKITPSRTTNCSPCCAGFFCPQGLTCKIPCPLGAYCPAASLNKTTGICDPYDYQLPPGERNHTCGGADRWADVVSGGEVFCPAGFYCPTTIQKIPCSSGHYCRKGSTSQTKCYNKGSCKPQSPNQDITVFGVLLIVALSLLLLIIYNFSGQILTNRERKQAKSREAAARMARETAHARERWKSAKDIAKKHAGGLQSQLSRTFSRNQSKGIPPIPPTAPQQSSKASTSKNKEPSDLTKMMHSLDENPDNEMGFNLQIGDKCLKKNMPKGKQMHTRSQIFKYAYGQIEKEKAMEQQNKNLTFSGVISMATDNDIRNRPVIEVAFKDLTLTLRGSKKKILRSVTGKLMPGRVAALMGPSGAGKTTYLNAVSGKATGCETSGAVLINGKPEPIRAYRKIIGFVPQDDIVHGNLTVEENLWFSARCRLSADISKADKVLVVERVIESLGLQAIRDSLVGTVEKRGISGGQRKRVNVGLEMVMEPSLLILDEPTSGLDSASSNLLLRALRREALEGVNICMVVHQPSYALFKMFDDLILLAKGGITVYHGSVKKVEEYFAGLGINVPERVNPPDYFIDILEGIVKPPGVNVKQLPLKWMIHNGYEIPRDMLQLLRAPDTAESGGEGSTSGSISGGGEGSTSGSISGGVADDEWSNVKIADELKKDENLERSHSKFGDLSNRRTPDVFRQYKYFLGRVCKQRLREARIQGVDYLILGLAGVCLGTLAKVSDETFGALGYTYTVIAVSLLCKIGALRSFQQEKLEYLRERASGMSSAAYFLARDTVDHFNTIIKPIVYLSMFYFFNNPRSSIQDNYIILVALVYCVTGIGYTFAISFQPGSAQLWSALLPVVLTLIATQANNAQWMKNLCYTKWALEAFVVSNAEKYSGVWLVTRCGSLMQNDYDIDEWWLSIAILLLYGITFRLVAYICMVRVLRK